MEEAPLVGVVMGSKSDYEVLKPAVDLLKDFQIPFEVRLVSAHRTPDWLFKYAEEAETRGLRVIIAGAGGAAHLPGMSGSPSEWTRAERLRTVLQGRRHLGQQVIEAIFVSSEPFSPADAEAYLRDLVRDVVSTRGRGD